MTNNPHSDETRLKQADIKYIHSLMSNNAYGTEELRIIRVLIDAWNRRPTPPAQPSGLSKGDRSAIESVLALLKNDDRCPAIRHALELLESMGNAVKFADKRFAERGIELTALQHDIAKANRQLTATQADLLNVRAELEKCREERDELTRRLEIDQDQIDKRDEAVDTLLAANAALAARVKVLEDALRKLACLGNGDRFGNSDGNLIARAALTPPKEGGQS